MLMSVNRCRLESMQIRTTYGIQSRTSDVLNVIPKLQQLTKILLPLATSVSQLNAQQFDVKNISENYRITCDIYVNAHIGMTHAQSVIFRLTRYYYVLFYSLLF